METQRKAFSWRGRQYHQTQCSRSQLRELAARGECVVFDLDAPIEALASACAMARNLGLSVWGWIEVGRDELAAQAHPEWMHLPQHHEWLEAFPDWQGSYKALVYPWICVNNRGAFDYALERVAHLVLQAPPLDGLFLNDIQGAPVGCGCGNILCRSWDNSPGEKIAPTPYQNPDVFFSKVFWEACATRLSASLARENIVPILCGECEIGVTMGEADSPDKTRGTCRGIPCSRPCALVYWPGMVRAFAEEAGGAAWKGVLAPYKLFDRDVPLYGTTGAWAGASLTHYQEYDPNANLIAVLQGWNVDNKEMEAQRNQVLSAGASGILILETVLEQSWRPVPLPEDYTPTVPPVMCGH